MRHRIAVLVFAGLVLRFGPGLAVANGQVAAPKQDAPPAVTPVLTKPQWKKGDSWMLDTVTKKLQGREEESAQVASRIRWRFTVTDVEKIGERSCWRIDIECLAKGRLKPATTIWVDQETLFLRQFETQFPVAGVLRTVRETYEAVDGGPSPVLPPINVLPVSLPAFISAAPKGVFKYTSQSTGQAKEVGAGAVRFVHATTQEVAAPSAKSLESVPRAISKSLLEEPAVEVRLGGAQQQVVQVWQPSQPWAVYSDDGHTQSWLVVEAGAGDAKR